MTIAQGYKPHMMHHATELPRRVESEAEKTQAEADGYGLTYVHQPYPTTLYKTKGKGKDAVTSSKVANNAAEEKAALSDGWSKDAPALAGGAAE